MISKDADLYDDAKKASVKNVVLQRPPNKKIRLKHLALNGFF